jgi:cell fate (sporulation/competence/biofilm development) regulator YmcA (YheA/YmcA/DUF963 family)
MGYILIVVTLAVSQAHLKLDQHWSAVVMQRFETREACEQAAQSIKVMSRDWVPAMTCAPEGKRP